MFIQFLIEDYSGEVLIRAVITKYNEISNNIIEYDIKSYKGIGGFKKGETAQNIKSEHLLTDLPKRLRAYNSILTNRENASIFIIVDNDTRNPEDFKQKLNELSNTHNISIDHVYCIAIEELEAWLLGDIDAIKTAYPKCKLGARYNEYKQDSICGTWEILADMLTKSRIGQKSKKENLDYSEIGRLKSEWAKKIGAELNIKENRSPSFQYFIRELDKRNVI